MEINLELLEARKKELLAQLDTLKSNASAINGALQLIEHLKGLLLKPVENVSEDAMATLLKEAKLVSKPGE